MESSCSSSRQVTLEGQVLGPDVAASQELLDLGPGRPGNRISMEVLTASSERIVQDPAGRFKLGLDPEGKAWVGVRAAGNCQAGRS